MTALDPHRQSRSISRIDGSIRRKIDAWTAFWFTPMDPLPLCLLRILVGGMLIYIHIVWGMDLPAFLGPDGWNSEEVVRRLQRDQWNTSFWWAVPVESMQMVHDACFVVLLSFFLGFCTRITSILAFIIHVSYSQRAAMSNFGLDQIIGILTMYLMLAPCGDAYSLDAVIRRGWRAIRNWKTRRNDHSIAIRRSAAAGLALRLIQIHYCVIYFFAATGKLQGESWWNGQAFWRAVSNYEYQSTDLTWLAWFPEIVELLTHITVLWELSFAYLVWNAKFRPLMLGIGVMVHLGIGAFLGMWTFGSAMIFGYIAFARPETVRAVVAFPCRWFQWPHAESRAPISFDAAQA